MSHPQTIHLERRMLGLKPYVVIEFYIGDEGDDDLRASVSAGGGIGSAAEIREALEMALASLPDDEPADFQESTGAEQ